MSLTIHLIWDASTNTAPAGFKTQIQQAANILQADFTDNVTINIRVGWGEVDGTSLGAQYIAEGGPDYVYNLTYSQVKSWLGYDGKSADDLKALASLPATNPHGTATYEISTAQGKAMGIGSPTDPGVDGSIGFGTGWTSNWLPVALHEITHAMGRVDQSAFDLFRFSSPGVRQFTSGLPAYFSIDGGVTHLANFGVASDTSDFKNDYLTPSDVFDEYVSSATTLSQLDLRVMDVLGFDRAESISTDLTTSKFSLHGTTATYTVSNPGGIFATASESGVYLSNHNSLEGSTTVLGTHFTPQLASGASDTETTTLAFPTNLAPGTYYLGAYADATQIINENNEFNNTSNLQAVILGNDSANTLAGTAGADFMVAQGGNDSFSGGAGDDSIYGGSGDDVIDGGAGNDSLDGGIGTDTVTYASATAAVTVSLALTTAQNTIGAGTDVLSGFENLTGSNFADHLTGNASPNVIIGGAGADTLTGGLGADVFMYKATGDSTVAAPDVITDFSHAQIDRIGLAAIDANTGVAGDQAFTLVAHFTHAAAQLTEIAKPGGWLVEGDVNGDGNADFAIMVDTTAAPVAGDFLL
jgi:Ca2+-binding RTX toxin-like protein